MELNGAKNIVSQSEIVAAAGSDDVATQLMAMRVAAMRGIQVVVDQLSTDEKLRVVKHLMRDHAGDLAIMDAIMELLKQ